MDQPMQLPLFPEQVEQERDEASQLKDYGTFKDNLKAPIHSWFRYPAGYSYRFVEFVFSESNLGNDSWVYDPFSGTGTTLVCAKTKGINAYGVEAHAFVHWVASVKLYWDFDYTSLRQTLNKLVEEARNFAEQPVNIVNIFPELVYKCYHPQTLQQLYLLREYILNASTEEPIRQLMKLALTDTLRNAAAAGTGWPYIAPNKNTGDKPPKDASRIFRETLNKMHQHLYMVGRTAPDSEVRNIRGDSRKRQTMETGQIDLALTSPPYLNNYDYADRTRLETYFWGITRTWKDITELYRNNLMVAATTQIVRGRYIVEETLSREIELLDTNIYETLQKNVLELSQKRLTKGGKKDYDLMVALYFNDMLAVLRETHRLLAPGAKFYLVLGDSAPYGVHIATENIIAQLGLALGFRQSDYIEFRKRGGKWKKNPQRHNVQLREGCLILEK